MATEEQIKKTMRGMYESFGTIREEMVGDVVTFDEFIQGPSTVVTDEETYTFDRERLEQMARAALEALEPEPTHPDDLAVDAFARDMKAKLAKKRAEGRGGWEDREQCSATFLSRLLREHVEKGDPLDVGNLAMMLHIRGDCIEAVEQEPLEDVLEKSGVYQINFTRHEGQIFASVICSDGTLWGDVRGAFGPTKVEAIRQAVKAAQGETA